MIIDFGFRIGGFPVETKSGIIGHKHYFKTIVFLNTVKELYTNRDYRKAWRFYTGHRS